MVLVNPQCQFTLVSNDDILLELPAGTSKQRIEQVFGKSVSKQYTAGLVEIKTDTDLVSIRGFIGKPEQAGKNAQQFFFVNNRYMKHPYFHKAVLTAYQGMLLPDYQPSYFIYFDVNPEMIDVNIHPTKTEIKFADEQAVWQILQATIREALGKFNVAPSLDFENPESLEIPVAPVDVNEVHRPEISFDPTYNPFASRTTYSPWETPSTPTSGRSGAFAEHKPSVTGWEQLYGERTEWQQTELPEMTLFDEDLSALTPYQYAGRYILLPARGGLLFVDQHRAHTLVLYEQMRATFEEHKGHTQQVLFPEVIELPQDDMALVASAMDDLTWVGFRLDQFSPTAYSISGVPALLPGDSGLEVLRSILDVLRLNGETVRTEWRNKIAMEMAEKSAIPYGKMLSEEEMRDLLQRLFALDSYAKTPAGKKVLNLMPIGDIDKLLC